MRVWLANKREPNVIALELQASRRAFAHRRPVASRGRFPNGQAKRHRSHLVPLSRQPGGVVEISGRSAASDDSIRESQLKPVN